MRFFNTTGPVQQERHYAVPPLSRPNLDEVLGLIRTARYFVMHAPRQTGKTSVLLALQNLLNGGTEGDYRCLYINLEAGQAAREDTARAMQAILGELALRARLVLQDRQLDAVWPEVLDTVGPDDYRIHSSAANAVVTGGSAFNIKARSLRLGDFSRGEMQALLAQHTRSCVARLTWTSWPTG